MSAQNSIDWRDVIKKEARGPNDDDLGEVQDIGNTYVHTKKGLLNKKEFYLPKYLAEGYDGNMVRFRITEAEAEDMFTRETDADVDVDVDVDVEHFDEEKLGYREKYSREREELPDIENRIPLISEKLNVSKSQREDDVAVTKRPVVEQQSVEVPVTHEEVTIERRPVTTSETVTDHPTDTAEEIRIPVKSEEVHVTKTPYVEEEVVVKKEPVTETRTVTDEVRSETVDVESEGKVKKKEKI